MEIFRPQLIPDPTVRRLSLYLRELESFLSRDQKTISSKQLGDSLGLTDAQVRKDLAYFGTFGHPGVGYSVPDLLHRIRQVMGTDHTWRALLVGAGNIGRALLAYSGFGPKMLEIAAVFDADPAKIGQKLCDKPILDIAKLNEVVKANDIRLAILAVPTNAAQDVAEKVVEAGIKGILNFAPVQLCLPNTIEVQAVDLAVQLEQLAFLVSLNSMSREGVRHP